MTLTVLPDDEVLVWLKDSLVFCKVLQSNTSGVRILCAGSDEHVVPMERVASVCTASGTSEDTTATAELSVSIAISFQHLTRGMQSIFNSVNNAVATLVELPTD